MRALLSIALVAGLLLVPTGTHADSARELDAPYPPGDEAPRAPSRERVSPEPTMRPERPEFEDVEETEQVPAIQELSAQPSAEVGPRVFGDGLGDTVAWSDPELDLEPRGPVHLVLTFSGGWLGATTSFDEAGGGAVGLALDVALEPTTSLHLRFGVASALHTETQRRVAGGELRSSVLNVRGTLLVGVHLGQLVALRAGAELGEGHAFVFGTASGGTLGFALVAQAGIRLAGGRMELGVEAAAELREGSVLSAFAPAASIQEMAPRLSVFLALTP